MTRGSVVLVFAVAMMLASRANADSCLRVVRALAASTTPVPADFEPSACIAAKTASAFRYDPRSGTTQTTRALSKGDVILAPPAFALAAVRPGDKLIIRARSGPVIVEREVEALQPGYTGQRLFVRADDGNVFSIPLAEAQP